MQDQKQDLTIDGLPRQVARLTEDIQDLKRLLIESQEKISKIPAEQEEFLTISQAAKLLHLSVATIYSKVSRRELPVMRRGKRLYFSRVELLGYIQAGRRKTRADIEREVDQYSPNKKG